jgi:hypothetical protein
VRLTYPLCCSVSDNVDLVVEGSETQGQTMVDTDAARGDGGGADSKPGLSLSQAVVDASLVALCQSLPVQHLFRS